MRHRILSSDGRLPLPLNNGAACAWGRYAWGRYAAHFQSVLRSTTPPSPAILFVSLPPPLPSRSHPPHTTTQTRQQHEKLQKKSEGHAEEDPIQGLLRHGRTLVGGEAFCLSCDYSAGVRPRRRRTNTHALHVIPATTTCPPSPAHTSVGSFSGNKIPYLRRLFLGEQHALPPSATSYFSGDDIPYLRRVLLILGRQLLQSQRPKPVESGHHGHDRAESRELQNVTLP